MRPRRFSEVDIGLAVLLARGRCHPDALLTNVIRSSAHFLKGVGFAPATLTVRAASAPFTLIVWVDTAGNGYNTMASYFRFRLGLGHLRDRRNFGTFVNDRRRG